MSLDGGNSSQNSKKYQVLVDLSPSTPVVGCETNPGVRIGSQDPTPFNVADKPPPYVCEFSWYKETVFCHVHPPRKASLQCLPCRNLNMIKESYHCSRECFREAWEEHTNRHCQTKNPEITTDTNQPELKTLQSCGSWSQPEIEKSTLIDDEARVWSPLGTSKTYKPLLSDCGFRLKLECLAKVVSTGDDLAPRDVRIMDPVIEFPSHCPRRMINFKGIEAQCAAGVKFTVLSYNILSAVYHEQGRYDCCPEWARAWEYRRENLLREILQYDADIICLQEAQSNQLESFIKPELMKHGYSVKYKRKTDNELYTREGYVIDGCATFYRTSLFKEVKTYEVQFSKMASSVVEAMEPGLREDVRKRLQRDHVALVLILEVLQARKTGVFPPSRICVTNAHMISSAQVADVKLYQVVNLVHGLEKIRKSQIPLILCVDLNSLPNSHPLKFLLRCGTVPRKTDEQTDPCGIYSKLKLEHSLNLKSAYKSLLQAEGVEEHQRRKMDPNTLEPLFTSLTPTFSGTIDYILYSGECFTVNGVLEPLDRESIGAIGIPTAQWSSDHIALMAKFTLTSSPTAGSVLPPLPLDPWEQGSTSKPVVTVTKVQTAK